MAVQVDCLVVSPRPRSHLKIHIKIGYRSLSQRLVCPPRPLSVPVHSVLITVCVCVCVFVFVAVYLFIYCSVCFSRGSQPSHSPVPGGEPERGGESRLDASDHHQPAGLLRTGWWNNAALVFLPVCLLCISLPSPSEMQHDSATSACSSSCP